MALVCLFIMFPLATTIAKSLAPVVLMLDNAYEELGFHSHFRVSSRLQLKQKLKGQKLTVKLSSFEDKEWHAVLNRRSYREIGELRCEQKRRRQQFQSRNISKVDFVSKI